MTRPDLTIVVGQDSAIVNGDRAEDLIAGIGATRTANWIGLEIPLADLDRALNYAHVRGWVVVEHGGPRRKVQDLTS